MSGYRAFIESGRQTFLQKRIIELSEKILVVKSKKEKKRLEWELEDCKKREADNSKNENLTMGDIESLIEEFGSIENKTDEDKKTLEFLEDMQVKFCKDHMNNLKYIRRFSEEKVFDIKR